MNIGLCIVLLIFVVIFAKIYKYLLIMIYILKRIRALIR